GCGACGGLVTRPGGPVGRPPALRPAAFDGWTRHGRRAARAARIVGLAPCPRPEERTRSRKTPQVERREATRLQVEGAPFEAPEAERRRRAEKGTKWWRLSALHP